MAHEFVIIRQGKQETYSRYEDIPLDLDHVIKFLPEIPPPPHTAEQHVEIESWLGRFQKIMEVERERWNR